MRLPLVLVSLGLGLGLGLVDAQQESRSSFLANALGQAHLSSALYSSALASLPAADFDAAGYPAWVRRRLVQINQHAASHQSTLQALLASTDDAAGASSPQQPCTTTTTSDDGRLDFTGRPTDFLLTASALSQLTSSAYLGALPSLFLATPPLDTSSSSSSSSASTAAASLMLSTARQSAWLDSAVLRGPAWSGPAEPRLPQGLEWDALWSWVAHRSELAPCGLASTNEGLASDGDEGPALFAQLTVQGKGGDGPVVHVEPGQTITLVRSSSSNDGQSSPQTPINFLLYSSLPPRLLPFTSSSSDSLTLTLPADIQGSAFGFLTTATTLPPPSSSTSTATMMTADDVEHPPPRFAKADLQAGPVVLSFGLASGAVSSAD